MEPELFAEQSLGQSRRNWTEGRAETAEAESGLRNKSVNIHLIMPEEERGELTSPSTQLSYYHGRRLWDGTWSNCQTKNLKLSQVFWNGLAKISALAPFVLKVYLE